MKTAIIYDQFGEKDIEFYVIEGDYSRLDKVYINSYEGDEDLQGELYHLMFNEEGDQILKKASKEEFCKAISKGAKLIVCGFIA